MAEELTVRRYTEADADDLMALLRREGEEWSCYWAPPAAQDYRRLLASSLTYLAFRGGQLCGYSRSLIDGAFYVYVCDLLVDKAHRGHHIGRRLMECIYADFPEHVVYVMSDVDGYYQKLGYRREGSVLEVTNPQG